MKHSRTLSALLAAALISFSLSSRAEVALLDRIVAIVDQTTITQSELDKRMSDIILRSQSQGMNLPPMSVLREQVLDQLVLETLQLNTARRYGIAISDAEVLGSINNIKQQRNLSDEQLVANLAQDGLTLNEFRENLRRQLTLQTISQGLVSSRIKISEHEIDNFLRSAEAKFWISPDYHLMHILVSVSQSADTGSIEEAQARADAIFEELSGGANFEEVAIAKSDGPAALQGGDLGWRKSSQLPSLFAEIAPKLEVGEVSQPHRSQAGFHILKLVDKRGETKQVVQQTLARHILIKTNELIDDARAKAKLEKMRQDIVDGADFGELAKEHSDDLGSKLQDGELGWANPGTFVPAFEETMAKLGEGEMSEPFKSQFGWHLMQVMERRDEDLSEDVIRSRAHNLLMNRRFEDEVQVWLQEMKDEAFIEMKI